ncbi:hypothetical protein SS50377_25338 [Spironucleus salmonicida]|nr:hypothetical protein SS50377_25338 [Spironucleus salmonicida]
MTLNEHDEVNRLLAQIRKLEQDITKVEDQTQKNYQQCDKYEKRLTKLTMANGALERQANELSQNDKSQLQTALQLIVKQTDAFEDEIKFMRRKNQKIEEEIHSIDTEGQIRIQKQQSTLRAEAKAAEQARIEVQRLQTSYQDLEASVYELKKQMEDQNTINQQIQQNTTQLQEIVQQRDQTITRPQIIAENIVESLCQDLKELSNDLIKLLVQAYENPQKFLSRSGKASYLDILSRIERKKAQILYLKGK